MKRVQLIEIGVLAVVLILGFRAVETIINIIIYTLYSFTPSYRDLWDYIWPNTITLAFYLLGFFILLRKRKWIANYILGKSEEKDEVSLRIEKAELLYIILICVCIVSLLTDVSNVLIYAFDYFKTEVGGSERWTPRPGGAISLATFKVSIIKFILTLVLFYFAKPLSDSLSRPSSNLPLAETDNKQ